ncbi:MAG: biopolymer transporter ExbD [Prevotellaceae bacterium]|jgi:biopolymer transport protein ExbD|nr:biopolymer transporter ExbD [Prevotellaceae bacterium]
MSKFGRKKSKEMPAISTASLPDVVYMLLFFFMVTTTMKQGEVIVKVIAPEATEWSKLERKSLVSYIYIGEPIRQYQAKFGTESRIQLNDSFRNLIDIRDFIAAEREARSEVDRQFMTTSLKIDQNTRMGIVTDVKQELRKVGALKISYSTRRQAGSEGAGGDS